MVKPKKHLGQHFLKDETISEDIVSSLKRLDKTGTVLEVGPGTGALTKYFQNKEVNFLAFEIDRDWKHPIFNQNIKNLIFSLSNSDISSIKKI